MPPRRRRTQAQIAEARRKARNARRHHLRTQHSRSEDQYLAILAFQGGVCALCGKPPQPGKNLHVDHDHAPARRGDPACDHPHEKSCSNCWRMLLHRHCNDFFALVRDSQELMLRGAALLNDPPARQWMRSDGAATLSGDDEAGRTVSDAGTTETGSCESPGILRSGPELLVRSGLVAPEDQLRGS